MNMEKDREYASAKAMGIKPVKPMTSSTKAVKTKKAGKAPKKGGSIPLARLNKWKRVLVYLKAKRDVAAGSSGLATWTSSDEAQLEKTNKRFMKARKMAAPELIKRMRNKIAARGRGKRRGSMLSKL